MAQRERGKTAAGFRAQVLQRLRNEALRTCIPSQRLQQQIAFERLLARLPRNGEWVLKTEQVESDRLSRSVDATFAIRRTHPLPERLPEPPVS